MASLRSLPALLVLLSLSVVPADAVEYEFFPARESEFGTSSFLRFGIRRWYNTGSVMFRRIYPSSVQTNPPDPAIKMGSTLNYRKIDSAMNMVYTEFRPIAWLSFAVEYGDSKSFRGSGDDHDWINAPGLNLQTPSGYIYTNPKHEDYSRQDFKIRGDTKLVNATAYLRVFGAKESDIDVSIDRTYFVDLALGYARYSDTFHMTDGSQGYAPDPYMNAVAGIPPIGDYPGLDSTYRFKWSGPSVGLRQETRLSPTLQTAAHINFFPRAKVTGLGYWNLRTDFKKDPSFRQSATGKALDFAADISWTVAGFLTVRAGYLIWYMAAADGKGLLYFSDGRVFEDSTEKMRSMRKGAFVDLSFQY